MAIIRVILIVLAAMVLLGTIFSLVRGLSRRTLAQRIRARHLPGDVLRVETWTNFFGIESLGYTQLRGNGALVLTKEGLHFHMLLPKREYEFRLAELRGTEIVRAHLGRSVGRELLKVWFERDGVTDSVAWLVAEPEAWRAAIAAPQSSTAFRKRAED